MAESRFAVTVSAGLTVTAMDPASLAVTRVALIVAWSWDDTACGAV